MNKKFLLTAVFGLFLTSNLNANNNIDSLYENIWQSVETAIQKNTLNAQKIDELLRPIEYDLNPNSFAPISTHQDAMHRFFNRLAESAQNGNLKDILMKLQNNELKLDLNNRYIDDVISGFPYPDEIDIEYDSLLVPLYYNNVLNNKNINILKEFHIINTRNLYFIKNIESSLLHLFAEENVSDKQILDILITFKKAGLLKDFMKKLKNNDKEAQSALRKILLSVAYNQKNNYAQKKIQIISKFFRGK